MGPNLFSNISNIFYSWDSGEKPVLPAYYQLIPYKVLLKPLNPHSKVLPSGHLRAFVEPSIVIQPITSQPCQLLRKKWPAS